TIGRGSNADIQLTAENRAISRIHLEIAEERGKIVVYNRASNVEATIFKGRPLTPNERLEIAPGDVLKIFETTITLL
ncbi:FHA domain-containing protein, partial [Acinetobacter baumannii]